MDARRRRELTRFGAPVAFLAAVTVAVLLIKSALSGNGSAPATVAVTARATHPAARAHRKASTVRRTPTSSVRYYTIQPGDTLGIVALHENTTVDQLLRLNPGIDPHTLHSGQRIRVG